MAMHPFHRTELLVGGAGFERLKNTRVCVVGLGGVGSFAVEALVRSGVGHLTLVDYDRVCITNLNRQLHATRKTVNQPKVALMAERVRSINPKCDAVELQRFYGRDSDAEILGPPEERRFDAVIDCIDNMTAKVQLIESCVRRGIPVYSALGAGGRMDPTRVRVTDLSETRNDPFARLVRDLLRQRGIHDGVICVWSDEPPVDLDEAAKSAFKCICPDQDDVAINHCETRFQVQGSNSWMPSIYGLTLAGVVVNRLLERPIHDLDLRVDPKSLRDKPSPHRPSRARKKALIEAAGRTET
jgi:tRNA A37 threonylcarbamoyladenosine dehydratase